MNLQHAEPWIKKPVCASYPSWDHLKVGEKVFALSIQLMQQPSLTPEDAGCQQIIRHRLARAGFDIQDMSRHGVTNTWATHGKQGPSLVLAGHTDVDSPGPLELWKTHPFIPQVTDNKLYGRGAVQMKTGLAAMVIAAERFIKKYPQHRGLLAFALTSDQSTGAVHGTQVIVDTLKTQQFTPDWCLVGGATSKETLGDVIKVGQHKTRPFLSPLLKATEETINHFNDEPPALSTADCTADGLFFSALGAYVVELGVRDKTARQCNESVKLEELTRLVFMYERILQQLLK